MVFVSIDVGEEGLETFKSDRWRLLSRGLGEVAIWVEVFCNWGGGTTGGGATEPTDGKLESVCAVLTGIDTLFIVDAVRGEISMVTFSWVEEGEIVEGTEEGTTEGTEEGTTEDGRFSTTGALGEMTEGDAEDEIGTIRGDT